MYMPGPPTAKERCFPGARNRRAVLQGKLRNGNSGLRDTGVSGGSPIINPNSQPFQAESNPVVFARPRLVYIKRASNRYGGGPIDPNWDLIVTAFWPGCWRPWSRRCGRLPHPPPPRTRLWWIPVPRWQVRNSLWRPGTLLPGERRRFKRSRGPHSL